MEQPSLEVFNRMKQLKFAVRRGIALPVNFNNNNNNNNSSVQIFERFF